MIRRPRPVLDTLPELTRYHDDGCDLHPACLTCPLPRCRYDQPEGSRNATNVTKEVRNETVLRVFLEEGLSARELAGRFRISKRTVHRILAAGRKARTEGKEPALSLSKGLRAESSRCIPSRSSVLSTQS
ncbi:MAG: recombinase family protein [Chloroflexi bacterium]|nr:recombinase family protein [Chloroflexota bacterium]